MIQSTGAVNVTGIFAPVTARRTVSVVGAMVVVEAAMVYGASSATAVGGGGD